MLVFDLIRLSMQLPHYSNSPRLAKDALVLGSSAAINGDSNFKCQQHFLSGQVFHNKPQHLNLHA